MSETPEDVTARTDNLLARMNIGPNDVGKYATDLRLKMDIFHSQPGAYRSAGTWAPGSETLSAEDRARAMLEFDWYANRYGYRVECIDGVDGIEDVPAWLGDQWRSWKTGVRKFIDMRVLGIRCPYSEPRA